MPYKYADLPKTQHSVFYSYSIVINNVAVGSFEKFSVSFTRAHERIREILFGRGAQTKEMLWSTTDISIDIDHVELYTESMLQALGFQLFTIEDLNQTVNVVEVMRIPGDSIGSIESGLGATPSGHRVITYEDCVPTSVRKEINTGTAKVIESMTLECRRVIGSGLPTRANNG
jgi:hypothetical protein